MLTEELAAPGRAQTAGRIGARQGKVSELTVFLRFVKGGAKRLRGFLQLLEGNFRAADAVGTVHDMRFVFVDNDTKLLFATAYDGDFDPYIEDFAAKIPNAMDLWLSNFEGYPGMRNPSAAADWIAKHQIAAEAWYVNSLYNGTHPYLAEYDEAAGRDWLQALDKISPRSNGRCCRATVCSTPDSSPRHIGETRRYLIDFVAASARSSTAKELYETMLARYPDRVNPGSLWGAANAVKPS